MANRYLTKGVQKDLDRAIAWMIEVGIPYEALPANRLRVYFLTKTIDIIVLSRRYDNKTTGRVGLISSTFTDFIKSHDTLS